MKNSVNFTKIYVFLFVFGVILSISGVFAESSLSSCGTINVSGNYVLSGDMFSWGGNCFNITADDVILDGKGFKITGDGSGNGIYSFTKSNLTLKGMNLNNFVKAIYLVGVKNSTVYDNNVSSSTYNIILLGSNDNNISNNMLSNGQYSIYFTSSEGNFISSNTISNNSIYGIFIGGSSPTSSNIIVSNNITSSNFKTIYDGSNDILSGNIINGKEIYFNYSLSNYEFNSTNSPNAGMIQCLLCNNISIRDLDLSSSNEYGIILKSSNNVFISNVTVIGNLFGISLQGSNSTVEKSFLGGNSYGLYVNGDNNSMENNFVNFSSIVGIYYTSSNAGSILNNTVVNSVGGIKLTNSSGSNIGGNIINSSTYGLRLLGSIFNVGEYNIFNLNNYSLYLENESSNNNFSYNNFSYSIINATSVDSSSLNNSFVNNSIISYVAPVEPTPDSTPAVDSTPTRRSGGGGGGGGGGSSSSVKKTVSTVNKGILNASDKVSGNFSVSNQTEVLKVNSSKQDSEFPWGVVSFVVSGILVGVFLVVLMFKSKKVKYK